MRERTGRTYGDLMAAAYTNHEIADALGAAEGTVKIHVSNIL